MKNGVDKVSRPLPGGGGGVRSIGDDFRPNLAMGGGSFRIPFDLPHGPGGVTPKLELLYHTGLGNGPFGMGWSLAVPFVQRRRTSPFTAPGVDSFTLSGAEPLIELPDGRFAPGCGTAPQFLERLGDGWTSTTQELVTTTFGTRPDARIEGEVDGAHRVVRWLLDTVTFANGVQAHYDYEEHDGEQRLAALRWGRFTLSLSYEARPDPSTSYELGLPQQSVSRCTAVELTHTPSGGAAVLARRWEFAYSQAAAVGTSLLTSVRLAAWHEADGARVQTSLPPTTFGYTAFDPANQRLHRMRAATVPPPPLGDETTLFDYRGTSLPGVLRLTDDGATWWENRGDGSFGAPEPIRALPGGVSLADDSVRFADLTGNGTADLIRAADSGSGLGGSWWEHDPVTGFTRARQLRLAPGFGTADGGGVFVDLDGDGIVDLLLFDERGPLGFFNDRGRGWSGPVALPWGDAPRGIGRDRRLRLADMNGDGMADLVLVRSRGVVYWPGLGNGRFGPPVEMGGTPDFAVADPDRDVLVADIDGDGTADLILLRAGSTVVHLNSGGRTYGPPITLNRTPALAGDRTLVADLAGSGCAGLVWTMPSVSGAGGYLCLDPLGGTKPYLLSRVDNGCGRVTEISYGTSSAERARDLAAGRRWDGYLPFPVHVVRQMDTRDTVTGQQASTRYRYHDGHFDGVTRQWLGFGDVESDETATGHELASRQHLYFHNQVATANTPAFVAGRGQPYRTDVVDPATGDILQSSRSDWDALPADPAHPEAGAWLAIERSRSATRFHDGTPYATDSVTYEHDDAANIVVEHRRGQWTDRDGATHVDELVTRTTFAVHATRGITGFPARRRHGDGTGQVLKSFDYHYDGPDFTGLPLGQVERGFLTRQTELAFTPQLRAAAYGDVPTAVAGLVGTALAALYRTESDPDLGEVLLKDMRRFCLDALGNQVETIDALGHHVKVTYDADGVSPTSITDGGAARPVEFDPVVQQATLVTDANAHTVRTKFDGLGNVIAVWRRDADPARPTETYTWNRSTVPTVVEQAVRVQPGDAQPGWVQRSYFDGSGRACQVRSRTADGRWAVAAADILSIRNRTIGATASYFDDLPDFAAVPAAVATRDSSYDAAGRLITEELYGGGRTHYAYPGAETHFHDPLTDPSVSPTPPPSRASRADAWGQVVEIVEQDTGQQAVERREYDGLGRLRRVVDPTGRTALATVFDGWGNRVRIDSADLGTTWRVLDALNNEVALIDADARVVWRTYDERGRPLETRDGGPTGPLETTRSYDAGPGTNLTGRLARVEGTFGTVAYSYDAEGNAVQIERTFTGDPATYTVGFGYDTQRNVRSVRYPDGRVVGYDYTPDGRLQSIDGVITSVEHGADGKRTAVTYANGLRTDRTFSPGDGLLTELVTRSSDGTAYQHLVHTLDSLGRVTQIDDLSTVAGKVRNNQTFEYDDRNRLIRATGAAGSAGPYDVHYRYDVLGNLVDGETFTTMVHTGDGADPVHPNRLVRRGTATTPEYGYDTSGNLTAGPELGTLHYDAHHRLVRVERPDGTRVRIDYDHDGRRVATRITAPGGPTRTRLEIEGVFVVDDAGTTAVVFDEDRRLALLPSHGNGLLHHTDRLGNINVISDLATGAFVANDEHTPFGVVTSSVLIATHYTFQGALLTDGLGLVLLGERWYSPELGRFLTADRWLAINQDRLPGIIAATNLYLYALDNPANYVDPSGRLAFLAILLIAVVVGAVLGAIGAAINGVQTWDEFLLWVVGGAIGGALAIFCWTGIILGVSALFGLGVSVATAATIGLIIFGTAGLLGAVVSPLLDNTDSPVAWFFSFLIKWVQSPILTTIGLIAALGVALGRGKVDFRRGMLFIEVGHGGGALTLGAVAWTQSGRFNPDGTVPDALARHESTHSRTVAAIGELGFYFTYATIGAIWGVAEGGSWNDLNAAGCGNPFEKTAHTFTGDPATARSTSDC
ncbi:FG-GAP-like repeat-containing protein [Streptomyces sp. HP-A2021]|uniref:toxin TcdB middle/N-terminal domain-containing protein n=1 Tax=Streptomyces sp. HP-A2021 TaxID=2927875 RepID=UPI001FAF6063|nr:toxin TcdB middle/N-terminal domain-containing protein [Streptomyces sp. HP-A2021]UOB07646.1 FG-GAP-like repeat-containing protein [Streptomyces sp. HP-A2021]